tara:strand:+ start:5668 stop:7002 length:1335 start_codon:yes stop_codon:yes gene_type:complete
MFDILYRYNGNQFLDLELSQSYMPLEKICQLEKHCEYKFNVVNNLEFENFKYNTCIVPIDYQSTKLSNEGRGKYFGHSDLGNKVEELLEELNKKLMVEKNIIILLYTSTEPFFHDSHLYISKIAKKYPNFKFIVSGSGEVENKLQENFEVLKEQNNVSLISKMWYLDRVHYNTQLLNPNMWQDRHFNNTEKEPPIDTPDYATVPNRFLLTMRNARSHRVLMSTLFENNTKGLNNVRYSRLWSLHPGYLNSIHNDPNTKDEYAYQVELITTAIQDCIRNDIGGKLLADLVKVTYRSPHKLDMKTIAEVGHPPKWLYENIDIALISGGEGTGYGYVDEKQLIPIYYKKPFITFGCKGIYKEMKKLGFDPYDNFWDISYDEENNFFERIYSCYMLVKKLDELSPDEFKELIDSTQDTVEYNFDHLVSGNFRDLSNNNFFKELLDASS